jgi:hypothetical protein
MEVPLYQLFYDGEKAAVPPNFLKRKGADEAGWGNAGKDARALGRFRAFLGRMEEPDRRLLFHMAQKMARPTRNRV